MINITSIDRDEALRYLSYRGNEDIGEIAAAYLDECEKRLIESIRAKYVYKCFPLEWENGQPKTVGCALSLEGKDIAAHLSGCSRIIIMAATVGSGVDRLIRMYQVSDMAKAVITDAFASSAVEQVCNAAEGEIKAEIGEGYFTWRYSPGYGDLSLELQKPLLDAVDAPRRIGLCTSESSLLTPIKSVTALIGVSDTALPAKAGGCVTCTMNKVCQFRKRGLHCGF